jgi:alpha-glucosidase (family GH31 glycosyl hydrolase)
MSDVKRIAFLALVVACSSSNPKPPAPIVLSTPEMTVTIGSPQFSIEVKNAKGDVILRSSTLGGNYAALGATHRAIDFRSHLIEGWDYQTATDAPLVETGRVVTATHTDTTAAIQVDDGMGKLQATVTISITGSELKLDVSFDGTRPMTDDEAPQGFNLASMGFDLPADEHFYGLGEHLVSVDHRGRTMYSWVEEGGIGLGEDKPPGPNNPSPNGPSMSHSPVPFFISTEGFGAWMDTGFRTGQSFGDEQPTAWRLWAFEPALHLHLFVHDDPKASITDFTAKTGRARLPAPWVFGNRRRMDSGGMVQGVPEIQLLRQKNVPCTSADDAMHFLPIGSQVGREAELKQWTTDLHTLGYKAIGYYNAYVSVNDARATADRDEGRSKGYFVKQEDGSEFDTFMISAGPQTVATIDLTNPDAVTWYGTLLERSIDLGYDGFMLDFGEYLPPHAKMFDGKSGWEAHNLFPVVYQKAAFDYMTKVKGTDFEFFARAGYTGTQAVIPMHWSGDPDASFDDAKGLPAQVRAGITAGISGIPYWGSDVTGYTCLNNPPADKDVFLRWVEFGALSPDMHEENACSGTMPQQKWTLWSDAETTQVYGDYARLHTRLFPYIYGLAKEAADTGMPIMRHPWLVHPTEPQSYGVDLEYYFGPSLYVAPVVRRAATTRDLWLPPGKWIDWFTLDPLATGKISRPAPLTSLPLFLKSGGIVPMLDPTIMTLAPATDPLVITTDKVADVLDARVALDPGATTASFTMADGSTLEATLVGGDIAFPMGSSPSQDISTCMMCGYVAMLPSGVKHVAFASSSEMQGTLNLGALILKHANPTARRIRWDVAILP